MTIRIIIIGKGSNALLTNICQFNSLIWLYVKQASDLSTVF